MLKNLLLIFIGGGLGSTLRFFLSQLNQYYSYGTFLANVLGCLVIGFVLGLYEKEIFADFHKLVFAVGFCGGFTTFSSFIAENYKLLQTGDYFTFLSYIVLSIVVGLAMIIVGFKISTYF
ncbi:fluoride efflux transporter CrcB [Weeksellaceae bacterium TAE3-ERU29]|nr:fluoride efflux transporter CrcB [Weeksellaceae bacterium TAE3-ERU29]